MAAEIVEVGKTGSGISNAAGGVGTWLSENAWWMITLVVGTLLFVFIWKLLQANQGRKKLQRDALEKLRRGLIKSAKRNKGPAKTIWLSGGPGHPPVKMGRYLGHLSTVELTWLCYRPHLFAHSEIFAVNPVDLGSLDVPEIQVRALSVQLVRELGFASPDVHDRTQRNEWARAQGEHYATPQEFAEAWKDYFSRAVDNAVAYYDSLNAIEDRSFLRQEVTRSPEEITETEVVTTKSPDDPQPDATNRT
jgi:hypothetical protein